VEDSIEMFVGEYELFDMVIKQLPYMIVIINKFMK